MSSILETFYILFESNADKAKKGVEEAQTATVGFDEKLRATDEHVALVGEHIGHVFEYVAERIAAVFAIEKVLEFTTQTVELNAKLGITSERLGIAVEDLSAWQNATKRAGGDAEGFTQTLDYLNRGMADIATKGTSRLKPFFDELKIRVTDAPHQVRPLLDILKELGDKTRAMGAQQRAGIFEKLGIDQGTGLLIVENGLDDIIKKQKELGAVTKEQTEIAHKFEQQLDDLGVMFRHITNVITEAILPAWTAASEALKTGITFIGDHKGLIEGFFVGLAGIIGTVYTPAVIRAAVATFAWLFELLAVPLLIAAVAAAFAFLYDDVKNFLAGNNSVIGELSKKWPIIGEVVREVVTDIVAIFQWWLASQKAVLEFVIEFGKLIGASIAAGGRLAVEAFEWLAAKGHAIIQSLIQAFPVLGAVFKGIGDGIMGVFHAIGAVWDWLVDKIKASIGWIAETVKLLPKALGNWSKDLAKVTAVVSTVAQPAGAAPPARPERLAEVAKRNEADARIHHTIEAVQKGQNQIHTANTTPLASHTSQAISHSRTQHVTKKVSVTTGPITVVTQAKDPEAVSRELAGHLKNHMRQAMNHVDDGVDR